MKYTGLVIGDIHWDAFDANTLYSELIYAFIQKIESMDNLHFIIINGDYFDRKLYMNTTSALLSIEFMDNLVSLIREKHPDTKIRILYGTESHDAGQLKIFESYVSSNSIDFKIIYTVTEEELFPKVNVLYIPEELVRNKNSHYDDYLLKENHYDFIFGHGAIQEAMTYLKDSNHDSTRLHSPVFSSAEFEFACKGYTIFSHYHINTEIGNKVMYTGSFSRWQHGEEEDKGYYEVTVDSKKKEYTRNFINNIKARKFITFYYGYNSSIFKDKDLLYKEFGHIDEIINEKLIEYIRLVINIPVDYEDAEFFIKYINQKYALNKNITVDITNGYVAKKQEESKEKIRDIYDKYGFIFDKSMKVEDKISEFIQVRYEKYITPQTILRLLG